jgi:hypothetical protein
MCTEVLATVGDAMHAHQPAGESNVPAENAGYEDYDSIAYELEIYLLRSIDVQSVALGPEHVFGTVQTMQKLLRASVRSATHLHMHPTCVPSGVR